MKLIDKDALVAEIERRKKYYENIQMIKSVYESNIEDFNELLFFIDTLEVKEVDFEKEIKEEYLERRHYGGRFNMLIILNESQFNDIAKHFFELGLKAQKEELIMEQYISKSAVMEEIEARYNECLKRAKIVDAEYWNGKADAFRDMLVVLDTLDVKEVDLD